VTLGRYQKYLVSSAKAKYGLLLRTEANRLMVQHWVSEQAKAHGVRPSHIVKILPIVVVMVFVPTAWDIEAKRIEATAEVANRTEGAKSWERAEKVPGWMFWKRRYVVGPTYVK
jgi:hypothetical protein